MTKPSDKTSITIPIFNYEDVILVRQKVRELMNQMQFSLLDQTRVVTAVSELARNIIVHAGKGKMQLTRHQKTDRTGFTCVFEDQGPGIADMDLAMREGYSTTNSLGLGLSGAKKLCREFSIKSSPGNGTCIKITEWKKQRIGLS